MVVGCFGTHDELKSATPTRILECCDIAEIRLDLLTSHATTPTPSLWHHLHHVPLLFTARRPDEGGGHSLTATQRCAMLKPALDHAAWIDIEVASLNEMPDILEAMKLRHTPWLASFHDFVKLPDFKVLDDAVRRARDAGASVFKVAAMLKSPDDLARLAQFQLADHGLPVATMGMGPLAAVSRLLCAQCGSVFNYGYLGNIATAPGQWDAALLKQLIARLVPLNDGDTFPTPP